MRVGGFCTNYVLCHVFAGVLFRCVMSWFKMNAGLVGCGLAGWMG